jgi:flagellar biosynthesis protein FlhF
MSVPTYVARDRAALAQAIERTRDADLVLIDTAGRSDPQSLSAQMDLVKSAPNVQLHLVLSVATGAREMGAVAKRYKGFGAERMIFTKLDEAEGPAGALAASTVIGRPVSCLCDGQRVPEDIHPVSEPMLIERFLAPTAALVPPNRGYGSASAAKEAFRGSGR